MPGLSNCTTMGQVYNRAVGICTGVGHRTPLRVTSIRICLSRYPGTRMEHWRLRFIGVPVPLTRLGAKSIFEVRS